MRAVQNILIRVDLLGNCLFEPNAPSEQRDTYGFTVGLFRDSTVGSIYCMQIQIFNPFLIAARISFPFSRIQTFYSTLHPYDPNLQHPNTAYYITYFTYSTV